MKIVQLTAENVKRLQAVTITPDGAIVQITGRNGQGKSSVLDSIAYALGGKDVVCAKPIRHGEQKAKIVCKLDDLTVTRTFTAEGGGTLTVATAEGAKYGSPQAVLDKLVGRLTLDPLAFVRLPAKQQAETLKSLVGLDFTALDAERADRYAERTAVNRQKASLDSQLAALPQHDDAPEDEVSVADLMRQLQDGQRVSEERRKREADLRSDESLLRQREGDVARLRRELEVAEKRASEQQSTVELRRKNVDQVTPVDLEPFLGQIKEADAVNSKVRANLRRGEIADQVDKTRQKSESLTARIEAIDTEKRDKLASAAFPVPGLSFDESGVLYNGIPFGQASGAEQLRVSVSIGLAMNPKLRVLLIRDGSLLDADGLAALAALAAEKDAQVWIERVEDAGSVGVVIEDGTVVSTPEPVGAEA